MDPFSDVACFFFFSFFSASFGGVISDRARTAALIRWPNLPKDNNYLRKMLLVLVLIYYI
jgi:hypothetical protein